MKTCTLALLLFASFPVTLPGVQSLDGTWQASVDGGRHWQPIEVPGTIEDQLDVQFDGVSIYQREFPVPTIRPDKRIVLRFEAVATHATVWLDDRMLGEHLGGWTPFEFDITDQVRETDDHRMTLRVRCDERVGHNTQGFLPIIAPHFSGIWKGVHVDTSDQIGAEVASLDLPSLILTPDASRKQMTIKGIIVNWKPTHVAKLIVEGLESTPILTRLQVNDQGHFQVPIDVEMPSQWSPAAPNFYDLKLSLKGSSSDDQPFFQTVKRRFAFREMKVDGERLLLNGEPVQVRGVLNWGYAPPSVAPSLDEDFMRREIEFAQSYGFNLMKFCLWIPPKRYLELCDEMGMLAWIEYPTWHPDFSAEKLPELKTEYDEFFQYVREHPAVILHSLTCETGPSADINVIQVLYDQCKQRIPGAIVEDDSSWIAWNRVHDFYDDHPYGNNHTWIDTLQRLRTHIQEHGTKPLILGEAIAADTWTDPEPILAAMAESSATRETLPHWSPNFLLANKKWLEDWNRRMATPTSSQQLYDDSLRYGHLMRKFQIETFRREFPFGGYVVSVMRDVPLCAMGFFDYLGSEKDLASHWRWHGDTMLLLKTEQVQHSFDSGNNLQAEISISHFGKRIRNAVLTVEVSRDDDQALALNQEPIGRQTKHFVIEELSAGINGPWKVDFVASANATVPTRLVIRAELATESIKKTNQWHVWLMPGTGQQNVFVQRGAEPLFPAADGDLSDFLTQHQRTNMDEDRNPDSTLLGERETRTALFATKLDEQVLQCLKHSPVVLIANNKAGSFPTREHWFLRGGPIVSPQNAPSIIGNVSQPFDYSQMLRQLQHFDLAGPVVFDIQYLNDIQPCLMLWDNHDLDQVRTHGVLFAIQIPDHHRLFVSALNPSTPAGQFIHRALFANLDLTGHFGDNRSSAQFAKTLISQMHRQEISLESETWKFSPKSNQDAAPLGVARHWHQKDFEDHDWSDINIARSWESQGHPNLDGWAWYRLKVDIPDDWTAEKTYINFNGVDDYYDLFVNGERMGSGGNIEKRETAFELRSSHEITQHVKPGETIQIAIAVYDWYGAGGVFRPVTIGSQPHSDGPTILK